jgi:adenylate kinase
MIPGARLVMLGRQGAGKGTQCTRLSRHFVVPHISTGDMLRAAVKEGTEFGRKAQEYMSAGELLPNDIIIGVVEERLVKDDTRNRGYILDGFPRTLDQAESLAEITADQPLDLVIDLAVPTDVVLVRLASRRVCVDCGANYAVQSPPKHGWVCDHCGGDVIQRDDDTEEAIKRRLDIYEAETAPLIQWYEARDLLMVVDGDGDPDEVTARLIRAIDSARR